MGSAFRRAGRNWRLVVLFYFINVLFAAMMTVPAAWIFARDVMRSTVGAGLMKGFSYRWYIEFAQANSGYFSALLPQVLVVVSVYLILESFLAGGFFSGLSREGRVRMDAFLSASWSHFGPILFLTVVEVSFIFLLFELNGVLASVTGNVPAGGWSVHPESDPVFWRYVVILILFMTINMTADFSKAAVAIDNGGSFGKMIRGIRFTASHPLSAAGVYIGCTIVAAVFAGLYFAFLSANDSSTRAGVMREIAAGEIFVLIRIFSKLIFYAGEAALYTESRVEVITVKPEMLE